MGKCLFMRKGETHTEPVTYIGDPVFANNDWATIIEACQKNKIHPTWEIGDSKTMKINGTDYTIDIIGKNHDVYSDGSGTAPLTFQMHHCYAENYVINTKISYARRWSTCEMRTTYLPSILNLMPSEVQSGIKEVTKQTIQVEDSTALETTSDTLFLLAEIEVHGSITHTREGEGTQYEYYKAGNSKVKYMQGDSNPSSTWCRSPSAIVTNRFCRVGTAGEADSGTQTDNYYIVPAFCF